MVLSVICPEVAPQHASAASGYIRKEPFGGFRIYCLPLQTASYQKIDMLG